MCPPLHRIQFARRELGVELVKDVFIMPEDPTQNLPPALLSPIPSDLVVGGRKPQPPQLRPLLPLGASPGVAPPASPAAARLGPSSLAVNANVRAMAEARLLFVAQAYKLCRLLYLKASAMSVPAGSM